MALGKCVQNLALCVFFACSGVRPGVFGTFLVNGCFWQFLGNSGLLPFLGLSGEEAGFYFWVSGAGEIPG